MILIPIIESMDSILNEMPELVNKLEKNSSDLQNESINFIRKLEIYSEKYRLPITGQLSVIRGKILCSDAEFINAAKITLKEKKIQKKRYILNQLESAYNCVNQYLSDNRKIFTECERTVCQIIVRLKAKDLLRNCNFNKLSGETLIKLASKDGELSSALVQITGLIGVTNTKILFEKTMSIAGIYTKEEF